MTRIKSLRLILLVALVTFGCDGDSMTAPTDMSQVLQNTVRVPSLSIALVPDIQESSPFLVETLRGS